MQLPPNFEAVGVLELLHKATEDGMNEAMGTVGWKYIDIPWSTEKVWNQLLEVINFDDIKVVSMAGRNIGKDFARRGSILVSPNGMKALEAYAKSKKEEKDKDPES